MRDYTRFVVTSDARDGSGMLETSLGAHPEVRLQGEILGSACRAEWKSYGSARRVLDAVAYKRLSGPKAVGFKLFNWHADTNGFGDVYEYLREQRVLVVHLRRGNLLEKYVSLQLARQTGVWYRHRRRESPGPKLEVDCEEAVEYFERALAAYADHYDQLVGLPCVFVLYEELRADFHGAIRRVLSFLGVDTDIRVVPSIVKQETRSMRDIVENYEQLEAALRGTRWETFLRQ